jgi:hypothetical protein
MWIGFAASSRTLRQAPRILYKPVVKHYKKPSNDKKILHSNFEFNTSHLLWK